MRAPPTYEIRIADQLDEAALTSFAGLDVTVSAGVTVITGQFDQAALHGMLEMIRSLGLDLEEVRRVRGRILEGGLSDQAHLRDQGHRLVRSGYA